MNEDTLRGALRFRLSEESTEHMVRVAKERPEWFYAELIRYSRCGPQFAASVMRAVWGAPPRETNQKALRIAQALDDPDDPVEEIVASILGRLA